MLLGRLRRRQGLRICAHAHAKLMIHGVTSLMGKQSVGQSGAREDYKYTYGWADGLWGTHLRTGLSPLGLFLTFDFLNY